MTEHDHKVLMRENICLPICGRVVVERLEDRNMSVFVVESLVCVDFVLVGSRRRARKDAEGRRRRGEGSYLKRAIKRSEG